MKNLANHLFIYRDAYANKNKQKTRKRKISYFVLYLRNCILSRDAYSQRLQRFQKIKEE